MAQNFTLLFFPQQIANNAYSDAWKGTDMIPDPDISRLLRRAEQRVSKDMLERVISFASDSLRKKRNQ